MATRKLHGTDARGIGTGNKASGVEMTFLSMLFSHILPSVSTIAKY